MSTRAWPWSLFRFHFMALPLTLICAYFQNLQAHHHHVVNLLRPLSSEYHDDAYARPMHNEQHHLRSIHLSYVEFNPTNVSRFSNAPTQVVQEELVSPDYSQFGT
jgi:hypothetical protein